jgi:glycosyltransferase involved in cell wall biosynthesis
MTEAERRRGRAVIVHDFFIQDGGAERCAVEFARLIPEARVETTFFDARRFGDRIEPDRVRTWPLQRVVGPTERFRMLLPLYPAWFSLLDLRDAPFVLSSSIAFTHAVRTAPGAMHVSYVYTPMRYAWDLDSYLAGSSLSPASRLAARTIRPLLRRWDRRTAGRAGVLVAISETVAERIQRLWRRRAETVIYPPVDTSHFRADRSSEGFLLVAARLLAYRRIDLAVAAATRLGRELVIVGDGPELTRLQAMAGSTVSFLGHVDRTRLVDLFERCHAYLVPGAEDFGIAPVEAMAAGKPVVALAEGGARETVRDGQTGVLVPTADVASFIAGIERLDERTWDRQAIRAHAERFDTAVFIRSWRELLSRLGVDPGLYSAG